MQLPTTSHTAYMALGNSNFLAVPFAVGFQFAASVTVNSPSAVIAAT